MKKHICIFILSFFGLVFNVTAQQKYGHIKSDEILESMPEFKQLKSTIESKKNQYAGQLQKMYTEYQQKSDEINKYGAAMMEAVREERLKEMESLQQRITGFQENANGDIDKLQAKLMQPLNDKYLKIVQLVAKENNYSYIFDVSTGSVAYYPENTGDITDLVKKKMGIN